jgi:hypothetical protein
MVTSQVKMRHTAELTCSYQGAISETIVYSRKKLDVEKNYNATQELIKRIDSNTDVKRSPIRKSKQSEMPGKYMWPDVNADYVLDFLKEYITPPHARRVNTSLLAQYIQNQIDNGDLTRWSVLIAGKGPEGEISVNFAGYPTGLLKRSNHPKLPLDKPLPAPLVYRIRRLVSPSDESWDLTESQYQQALNITDVKRSTRPGGEEIRVARDKSKALLILYPLEIQDWTGPDEATEACYIGFAISFPGNKSDKPIKYRVNQVYQGQMDE